ncbi:hypothetical protein [Pseudaestuariivita rosea]|uniref:hypothetical protein n=1 Tax=Pseudaestuariivita rosea TaxID=2763263 RepID=UPI001ABAA61B|nr:hypothetical protein [Pseudaestuariivita rosea]
MANSNQISNNLKNLLSYFDSNAYYPDEVKEYIIECSDDKRQELELELKRMISGSGDVANILETNTGFGIKDQKTAKKFFDDLRIHLFDNGPVPEI